MQGLVRMSNFIRSGLVVGQKKLYNLRGYATIKAREIYKESRLVQIVGRLKYVGRR